MLSRHLSSSSNKCTFSCTVRVTSDTNVLCNILGRFGSVTMAEHVLRVLVIHPERSPVGRSPVTSWQLRFTFSIGCRGSKTGEVYGSRADIPGPKAILTDLLYVVVCFLHLVILVMGKHSLERSKLRSVALRLLIEREETGE